MATAFYPGSFDPFTNGHLYVVKIAAKLFDKVYIGVGRNPKKSPFHAAPMASLIAKTLEEEGISNCEIVNYDNLTIEKAEELECACIIRGIRHKEDYEYEKELDETNRYLNCQIPTLFIPAIYNISSTMVRGLIENKFSIKRFVPRPVAEYYE
jgi:pantetheine-phosphate adenylyltransferase